ncbi:hypothetical protein LTR56_005672 [Elasticomyces elasticus]|nr:hypothetical protein LTR56_005672 [Elasticomyces elasticus]KAK3663941.1 hypothetical protein LTR22_005161 [Elasticomyces elasticus]KAK4927413.1 hypothetical protein LTR49_005818 [Elasticomyces elasticus]KAK5763377.1 hypothetical protein LTS12_006552 [Elasticomyces elasticus]
MASTSSSRCDHLAHPSPLTTALAAVLLFGILLSYLPQHLKILSRRSSEGLSPWWVLLGALSSIAALGNILTLPTSREDVACCKQIGKGECAAALLGVAQIGCQWGCFMFIVMLFLIYFPHPTSTTADLTSSVSSLTSPATPPPKRRDAVIVAVTTTLALLTIGATSLVLVAAYPHHTQTWANLLGVIAGLLSAVQYVPQIWYTWHLRDVKSLSVITMLIQVPGAFLFAFSLWQRVGWEGWSTWAVYIVTGFLQGILLVMAIVYYVQHRQAEKENQRRLDENGYIAGVDDVDGGAEDADERTGLLSRNGTVRRKSKPTNNGRIAINGGSGRMQRESNARDRQLSMLYAATPPEHDSDRSQ